MEHTDRELVESFLRTRGEEPFRLLYARHSPYLFGLASRLLGPAREDAADALQDAWLRASRSLVDLQWRSSLRTWLAGILVNCCREITRRRIRRVELELTGEFLDAVAPIERPISTSDLERALAQLPEGYRTLIVLHDVNGFTHEEIGSILGINIGTSKSQLSRGRKAIRMLLTQQPGAKDEER